MKNFLNFVILIIFSVFVESNAYGAPLISTDSDNVLPKPGKCGIDASDRIFGGTETQVDEFPWMALLEYTKPLNAKGFHCAGVLISKRYVVTACHCVIGKGFPSDWLLSSVRLGEYDLSTDVDCVDEDDCNESAIDVPISEKIPHEEYNPRSKNRANDIGLLRLQYDVPFTDFIKPICLPREQQLQSFNYDGATLEAAGWGDTNPETTSHSNVKRKVRINVVSFQHCSEVYNRLHVTLQSTQLCAGGKGDTCRGDSGGPIMTIDNSGDFPYWYLVGVTSFGLARCGVDGSPSIYTNVGSFVDWIESKVHA